jgi:hypothetical protein
LTNKQEKLTALLDTITKEEATILARQKVMFGLFILSFLLFTSFFLILFPFSQRRSVLLHISSMHNYQELKVLLYGRFGKAINLEE